MTASVEMTGSVATTGPDRAAHRPLHHWDRGERRDRRGREVDAVSAGLIPATAFAVVLCGTALLAAALAPPDAVQGSWQRLMYVHVPAAWVAYLAFTGVLAAGVVELRRPALRSGARRWARAAAEVGVAATALTLAAGSLWGHAVWGVWWAWDARLVSTAMMLAVYVGYLGLLGPATEDSGRGRRGAPWAGILGFAIVPVVHFSVVWWTTLHQQATVLAPPTQAPPIDPRMAVALAISVLAATSLGLLGLLLRVRAAGPRASSAASERPDPAAPCGPPPPAGTR